MPPSSPWPSWPPSPPGASLDPTRLSTVSFEVPDPGNRRQALATSLDTLADHPLLGTGPGTLPGRNRGVPFRAHLTPLNIAATVGVPALVAVTAALALLWRRRPRPTDVALWSGFAGVGIDALGQDVEHFRHVWILVGLAAAAVASRAPTPPGDRPEGEPGAPPSGRVPSGPAAEVAAA